MTGTVLNVVAIIAGGAIGILAGSKLPERLRQTIVAILGVFTFGLGVQMFLKTQNSMIVLGALIVGGLLGEWLRIEDRLAGLGEWLEARFNKKRGEGEDGVGGAERFIRGFLTASLIFCIGPIAILGSIEDGLTGNFQLLAVKSALDGVFTIAFASTLGVGVVFSALPVLVYQGAISLLAGAVKAVMTDAMMLEMTATGGVMLMALALSGLLEIKKIRTGNLLPALIIAPIIVALL